MVFLGFSRLRSFFLLAALFSATVTLLVAHTGGNPALAAPGDPPIAGQIFLDFDRDGYIDTGEAVADTHHLWPAGGVSIVASDAAGGTSAAAVASDGSYSIDVTGLSGSTFRVEAAPADSSYVDTFAGANHTAEVLRANAGDSVDFGFLPPSSCPVDGTGADSNGNHHQGKLWVTCYVAGDRSDAGGPQDVLVSFNYDRSGAVEHLSDKSALGSLWGIAYNEWDGTLFTSSFLRRHSELGPEGLDGLYWIDYPSETIKQVSLDGLGGPSYGTVGVRDADTAVHNTPNVDGAIYPLVGATGIGAIDTTLDGSTLLVVNIEAKAIVAYDITSAAGGAGTVSYRSHYSITDGNVACPDNSGSADPSDWYPFGLSVLDADTAYVSITCTAGTSQDRSDLEGAILTMDLDETSASVPTGVSARFPIDLTYTRSCSLAGCSAGDGNWQPWLSAFGPFYIDDTFGSIHWVNHSTPLVGDIGLEPDGSINLSILDRFGYQLGSNHYDNVAAGDTYNALTNGDLVHICNTSDANNPTFVMEGSIGCTTTNFVNPGATTPAQVGNHYGIGGTVEWFGEELASNAFDLFEATTGGSWTHTFLNEVASAQFDPFVGFSAGLEWYDADTGAINAGYQLYVGEGPTGFFGKSGGLGDVEGCAIPVALGNLVWFDTDDDGVQDADEPGITNATVTVTGTGLGAGVTVMTDSNGHWQIDSSDGLQVGQTYTIAVDPTTATAGLPSGTNAADLRTSTNDVTAGNDSSPDNSDSDIDVTTRQVVTVALTAGEVNHTYDAGFTLGVSTTPGPDPETESSLVETGTSPAQMMGIGSMVAVMSLSTVKIARLQRKKFSIKH